jgi:hypothetical protein
LETPDGKCVGRFIRDRFHRSAPSVGRTVGVSGGGLGVNVLVGGRGVGVLVRRGPPDLGVSVNVGVSSSVDVDVGVGVGVNVTRRRVAEGVGVAVEVSVAVAVALGVEVAVAVWVAVAVAVGVGVAVSVGSIVGTRLVAKLVGVGDDMDNRFGPANRAATPEIPSSASRTIAVANLLRRKRRIRINSCASN